MTIAAEAHAPPPGERICPVCQTRYQGAASQFCAKEGAYLVEPEELLAARGDRLLGRRIDQFAVAARVGIGGMGTVYRAIQVGVDRPVALKVLHRDLMGNTEIVQRFLQEARASARLKHRYVATTYTSGRTDDGIPYIAMEYVAGGSLRALIDTSFTADSQDAMAPEPGDPRGLPADPASPLYTLPVDRALRLCNQVVAALTQAHRLSIVHRDLKPDNVLLGHDEDEGEQAKIVDFGIAKIADREGMFQTKERSLLGTALYMAPELFQSAAADPRMDVYAVGLLLHELLSGFLPFERRRSERATPMVLVNRRLLAAAPPLILPGGVAPSLELANLLAALLDLDPQRRPSNAGEVRDRLREVPELSAAAAPLPSGIVSLANISLASLPLSVPAPALAAPILLPSPEARPVAQAMALAQAMDVSQLLQAGTQSEDTEQLARAPLNMTSDDTALVARSLPAQPEPVLDLTRTLVSRPEDMPAFTGPELDERGTAPVNGLLEQRQTVQSGILDLRATVVKQPTLTRTTPARALAETRIQATATRILAPRISERPNPNPLAPVATPSPRSERVTARPRRETMLFYGLVALVLVMMALVVVLAKLWF